MVESKYFGSGIFTKPTLLSALLTVKLKFFEFSMFVRLILTYTWLIVKYKFYCLSLLSDQTTLNLANFQTKIILHARSILFY
jgi:hypothetical protein